MTAFRFKRGTPFWDRMTRTSSGCLEWQGYRICLRGRLRGNYGQIRIDGVLVSVHRHAWELTYGPIPAGLQVLHRCDNPPCCEPSHLFLGTLADNMRDAAAKGRTAIQRGEDHGAHKFTDADVAAMRAMRSGGALLREVAARFGVEESYASRLCRKESRP